MIRQATTQTQLIFQAKRNEKLSPSQVRDLQNRKLRDMVHHAWQHTTFYREKLRQAGITPQDIQTVEDLVKLPPTTKDELRAANLGDVLADGYSPANTICEPTSGSSGKVLDIYHSHHAYDTYFANAFRHLSSIGYRPWHRVAYTAYDPLLPLPWEKIGLGRRQQIDLKDNDPRQYLDTLLKINPDLITAYPSILQLIIGSATPAELAHIRPRAIHLHSELLTTGIRRTIQDAFQCDCFDDYSTFEFHHVAYECPHHQYHIAADNVVVEFDHNGRAATSGEEGEILITGLTNKAMPLLRYQIGDVGIPDDVHCSCGLGFPVMKLIQGRVDDYIVLPSGRRFSPRMINPAYEMIPGILEHVLVQETTDHFVVYLNLADGHKEETPNLVRSTLRELFAEPVHIDIQLTTAFERGRTGKLRSIVSKVQQPA